MLYGCGQVSSLGSVKRLEIGMNTNGQRGFLNMVSAFYFNVIAYFEKSANNNCYLSIEIEEDDKITVLFCHIDRRLLNT